MIRLKIYTRFDTKDSIYFDICRDDSEDYKECSDELMPLFADEGCWTKLSADAKHFRYVISLLVKKEKHWAKAVTFGAMCLEAFIYDYAAHNFSDAYVKNYIDKLDLVSKWVIIPRLILGRDFPRDAKAFEYLVKLVKYRNELVHAKSAPLYQGDNDYEFFKSIRPRMKKEIERETYMRMRNLSPHEMVKEVLSALRRLEGEDDIATQWWQLEEVDDGFDDL